jgi:hypothetical protein
MTSGGALLVLFLLSVAVLAGTALVVAVRGGRGPGDPPASRPHVDPAGFFVLPAPRGLFEPGQRRRARVDRPTAARAAAAVHTARESRTARRMSALAGRRPSPRTGRTSTRLP